MRNCPHCNTVLEEILISPNGDCISFVCNNEGCVVCNTELYKCSGDKLLTRREFFDLKKEMNGG